MLAWSIIDKWSMLGDSGSKSAGNPDMCITPVRVAPLAPFGLETDGKKAKKNNRMCIEDVRMRIPRSLAI